MKSPTLEAQKVTPVFSEQINVGRLSLNAQPFRFGVLDQWLHNSLSYDLRAEFSHIFERGLSEVYDQHRLCRQGSYDAYSYVVPHDSSATSRVFYGRRWFDLVQSHFNIELAPYTLLAYHHHRPNGRCGIFHNDFDLVNFKSHAVNPWGLHVWHHEIPYLRYTPKAEDDAMRVRRAIAVIYYLSDPGQWVAGMGGETGLYAAANEFGLRLKVAPLHNRLLIFENSPLSIHRYEANSEWNRNCVIQWFHTSITQIESCFEV